MCGDALEMATVKRALTGVDVVTQSLGVSPGPEIILKPTRFFSKATSSIAVTSASDGSSVDMKSGLRELTALSLLAAFCWWSYVGSR